MDSFLKCLHHAICSTNESTRIDNPLARKLPEQVDREAREFAKKVCPDAPDEELFVKAARIARDPPGWENVAGLTEQERKALVSEWKLGFWRQTKTLRVTIATLSVAAIIQGWTQTGGNGANQNWPLEFGIADPTTKQIDGMRNAWIFASVNAITYLSASVSKLQSGL